MLARAVRFPEEAASLQPADWVYERKMDGLRCIAVRHGGQVQLWSRNHLPFNRRFPQLVSSMGRLPADSFVLDGEIVAFDGDRTSFQLLQGGTAGVDPAYVVFDMLALLGRDTTGLPLEDRTTLLHRLLVGSGSTGPGRLMESERLAGSPEDLRARACAEGWEGLIAKRRSSTYRSGRSSDWLKIKCHARQELVIGGWTEPAGSRTAFGALLVGYFEGADLVYAGKVGTGFDERTLRSLHTDLRRLEQIVSPFARTVAVKGAHWARPELVAEINFTEWTRDGRLRHPSFLGLRPDKAAASVVREAPRRL